uniref:Uncharacterized protein n=1 Tax=Fagus sylvatica TaxID=28930 RepID=A0A2N9FQH1_FAGSY
MVRPPGSESDFYWNDGFSAIRQSKWGFSDGSRLAVVLYDHKMFGSSSGHNPFAPSSRVLIILSRDRFVTSTFVELSSIVGYENPWDWDSANMIAYDCLPYESPYVLLCDCRECSVRLQLSLRAKLKKISSNFLKPEPALLSYSPSHRSGVPSQFSRHLLSPHRLTEPPHLLTSSPSRYLLSYSLSHRSGAAFAVLTAAPHRLTAAPHQVPVTCSPHLLTESRPSLHLSDLSTQK